ncbi:threonine dehydratase [Pedococcus bigeumensis]|uniref:Threonine dehydratase n=1 Tax=Pedococcus bigeumensis TaxID=433644 RepID=A0A502D4P6_9MICO|nr:threonine dehydratase [Pedococcus bigeumensis]TPG19802.1 threonine dehydratase [Pedococcus bigeumensis]
MSFTRAELDAATTVVRRHFPATAQLEWPLLSQHVGAEVWVKHENHTPTGAFKVRGGLVYADRAARERPEVKGFVSATRGNHGQSLAYAGRAAGLRVVIVVPEGNSPDKNAAMRGFGAELIVHGRDYQEAREHAMSLETDLGLEAVPPFHPDLVVGVGTYALELFEAAGPLDVVYVPVGMGSGICGLVGVRDLMGLPTEIVGVVSDQAPATALSFEAGGVVTTPDAATFVDGVACRAPVPDAVAEMVRGVSRILRVGEDGTAEAMRVLLRTTHQLPEPSGAIALAGLLSEHEQQAGRRVGVILSGGNCDADILRTVLSGETPTP